jgi:hypothetical protein
MTAASHLLACHGLAWLACNPTTASLLNSELAAVHTTLTRLHAASNDEDKEAVEHTLLMLQSNAAPVLPARLRTGPGMQPSWLQLDQACVGTASTRYTEAAKALHDVWQRDSSIRTSGDLSIADKAICLIQAAHRVSSTAQQPADHCLASSLARHASAEFAQRSVEGIFVEATHCASPDEECTAFQGLVESYLSSQDAISFSEKSLQPPDMVADCGTDGATSTTSDAGASERWIHVYSMLQASLQSTHAGLCLGQGMFPQWIACGCDRFWIAMRCSMPLCSIPPA